MELCTSRHLLLSVFILQLVIVSCRQIFDFLGYMWASVLANFLYTLFIIFGVFGVVQSKSKYTVAYVLSSFYWILWNLIVMCIYFDLFDSSKLRSFLSFYTNSITWWRINGPGCKYFVSNLTQVEKDPDEPITADFITGCVIDSEYVEGIQAIVHTILALCGFVLGIRVSHIFYTKTDDVASNKKQSNGLPLYSIEYSPRRPEELYDDDDEDDDSSRSHGDSDNRCTIMGGNRPMTPRRVKRRNVNSKSSHPLTYQPRQDQQPPPYFRKSSAYGSTRSSGRSSTRRQRATTHNPISKYLEQQQQYSFQQRILNDSSTSNDSYRPPLTSSQSQLLSAAELINSNKVGHVNPNFTSSTSLDRPPSARSSYSNYHGVRTLAYNNKQAAAQVPSNSIRRNSRPAYSTFFNDGPPAYEIQGVVNSETVI
ncbi:hypothetical protein V9T40_012584 [Parthenolecanium corni]|uniref:Sodium/potassium-transporting ATPase subunit beta-1-interacting protein n=1 Tax=Parthenolecanium corni TaxID=536013 RepID=A0AAN9T7I5_9HEMI